MTKFRKGDRVSLMGTVSHHMTADETRVFIAVDGHHTELWIEPIYTKVVQQAIEVGQTVRWIVNQTDWFGDVLAIADGHAWISRGNGEYSTVMLEKLQRTEV